MDLVDELIKKQKELEASKKVLSPSAQEGRELERLWLENNLGKLVVVKTGSAYTFHRIIKLRFYCGGSTERPFTILTKAVRVNLGRNRQVTGVYKSTETLDYLTIAEVRETMNGLPAEGKFNYRKYKLLDPSNLEKIQAIESLIDKAYEECVDAFHAMFSLERPRLKLKE